MNNGSRILLGAAAAAFCTQVWALTSWTLPATGSVSGGGLTATATGYANTVGTGSAVNNYTLETQTLTPYSGNTQFGIYNKDACGSFDYCDVSETQSPEHSIDNNERYEMALVAFAGGTANLTNFSIGWAGSDSDMTVLAYTGSGAPLLTGQTWSSLNPLINPASGWAIVGNYFNVAGGVSGTKSSTASITTSIYSSYWLIGAYNNLASMAAGTGCCYAGNDYVKLVSVAGNVRQDIPGVPEPGSLALIGLALVGIMSVSNRCRA